MALWEEHITTDPDICHGKPCIKGTRVMVSIVLDNVAEGLSPEKITEEYPALTIADVRASITYTAALAR